MKSISVTLYRKLTRLTYVVSVVFLLTSLALSLVNTTALADSDQPENPVPVIETVESNQEETVTPESEETQEPQQPQETEETQEPEGIEPTLTPTPGENDNGHNQNGQHENQGNGQDKTIVCHLTSSQTNPYEEIEVANPSVLEAHLEHGDWIVDANNPCPPAQPDEPTPTPEPSATFTPTPTFTLTPTATATLPNQPEIDGSVDFTTGDYAICQLTPTTISATVRVSLPEGVTGRLQTSFRIVNPPNKATGTTYWFYNNVSDGDEITVEGPWPGVDPGDSVVEIHFGARLSIPENGLDNELDTAGLDVYWYPWVCSLPTATPTVEPTPTETPSAPQELSLEPNCVGDGVEFTVFNPNAFAVEFDWESVDDPSQNGTETVPANSNLTFFKGPLAIDTVKISYLLEGETPTTLEASNETFCVDVEVTPTPTQPSGSNPTPTPTQPSGSNPTPTATQPGGPAVTPEPDDPQPTLAPPAVSGDPGVLIPVTGGDFSANSMMQRLFMNLGLVFLGVAFVLNGITNRIAKQ